MISKHMLLAKVACCLVPLLYALSLLTWYVSRYSSIILMFCILSTIVALSVVPRTWRASPKVAIFFVLTPALIFLFATTRWPGVIMSVGFDRLGVSRSKFLASCEGADFIEDDRTYYIGYCGSLSRIFDTENVYFVIDTSGQIMLPKWKRTEAWTAASSVLATAFVRNDFLDHAITKLSDPVFALALPKS